MDSVFQIGPITKVWTTTVVMQLATKGCFGRRIGQIAVRAYDVDDDYRRASRLGG